MTIPYEMIRKTITLCEDLKNKLGLVVRLNLNFKLFSWKKLFGGEKEKNFKKKKGKRMGTYDHKNEHKIKGISSRTSIYFSTFYTNWLLFSYYY